MTAVEMGGFVLLVLACYPALSQRIQTGAVTSVGLFLLALAGICYATRTGDGVRHWLLAGGALTVLAGEILAWRAGVRWWWVPLVLRRARLLPGRSKLWRD